MGGLESCAGALAVAGALLLVAWLWACCAAAGRADEWAERQQGGK